VRTQIEKVGETLLQTFAGLILDSSASQRGPSQSPQHKIQVLLNLFVFMNILHLCTALLLQRLCRAAPPLKLPNGNETNEATPLQRRPSGDEDEEADDVQVHFLPSSSTLPIDDGRAQTRGQTFMKIYFGFIVLTWAVFLVTAWAKLKGR
jgi:hypothetical protein